MLPGYWQPTLSLMLLAIEAHVLLEHRCTYSVPAVLVPKELDGDHGLGQYTRGTCVSSEPTGAAWVLAAAGGLEAGCSPCYLEHCICSPIDH